MKINVYYYVQESFSRDLVDIRSTGYHQIVRDIKRLAMLPLSLDRYNSAEGNSLKIDFQTISNETIITRTLRKILDDGPDLSSVEFHLFLPFS